MEDFHLIEKLQQFDREKTPERIVHARGITAKGTFEVSPPVLESTLDFKSQLEQKWHITALQLCSFAPKISFEFLSEEDHVMQVTHDISHLTSAAFLNGVGSKVSTIRRQAGP